MNRLEQLVEQMIPTNWCDSLLTGEAKVIHGPPYDNQDIERLCLAIRERLLTALRKGRT